MSNHGFDFDSPERARGFLDARAATCSRTSAPEVTNKVATGLNNPSTGDIEAERNHMSSLSSTRMEWP